MTVRKKTPLPFINGLRNRVIMSFKSQNDKKRTALEICQCNNAAFGRPRGETVAGMAGRQIEILYFDCS